MLQAYVNQTLRVNNAICSVKCRGTKLLMFFSVICEAAREVEDAMGLDVLDELTASLDDVKRMEDM